MAFKVMNSGDLWFLDILRQNWNAVPLLLSLFKNDHVPTEADVLGDYTECDFDGYAAVNPAAWSLPTLVAGRGLTAATPIVFLCTGVVTPNNVYGYYVQEIGGFELLYAERFAGAPLVMNSAGDTIGINPTFTVNTES